jgi:hypothetical protein
MPRAKRDHKPNPMYAIMGNAPGPDDWPLDPKEGPILREAKMMRAMRYHDDILAGRPIRFIPIGEEAREEK